LEIPGVGAPSVPETPRFAVAFAKETPGIAPAAAPRVVVLAFAAETPKRLGVCAPETPRFAVAFALEETPTLDALATDAPAIVIALDAFKKETCVRIHKKILIKNHNHSLTLE
jgi:hypothetical protein